MKTKQNLQHQAQKLIRFSIVLQLFLLFLFGKFILFYFIFLPEGERNPMDALVTKFQKMAAKNLNRI